jgi:hypothetical protein
LINWTGREAVGTLVLMEQDGVTTLTNTVRYSSPAAREAVLKRPMEQDMAAGDDQMERVLTDIQ